MVNWNTDEEKFKEVAPREYEMWKIIQMINYGLEGEKLDKQKLIKYWDIIRFELDVESKKTLEFLLFNKKWQKEPGLQNDKKNFWKWYHEYRTSHASI